MVEPTTLAASAEIGSLGVYHLKRLWSRAMLARSGATLDNDEEHLDGLVIDALGLGFL